MPWGKPQSHRAIDAPSWFPEGEEVVLARQFQLLGHLVIGAK
jgi:hypothetical protein